MNIQEDCSFFNELDHDILMPILTDVINRHYVLKPVIIQIHNLSQSGTFLGFLIFPLFL